MNIDQMGDLPHLAAVGFCTRALVESAAKTGFRVLSVDAFADYDCVKAAYGTRLVNQWGTNSAVQQILDWLREAGNPPVLLAGGTENWPELSLALQHQCLVLGPTPSQLRILRDPDFWQTAALEAGMRFPSRTGVESAGKVGNDWLFKRASGAGGLHVHRIGTAEHCSADSRAWVDRPADGYLQRFIPGRILGAHCVLADTGCGLMGVTEAWSSFDWPAPSEFVYRGSWGPITLTQVATESLARLSRYVHSNTGLTGWMQFDFVEDSADNLWLLEINPRWAAGMEILVDSGTAAPIESHLRAFALGTKLWTAQGLHKPSRKRKFRPAAKAIVYAEQDVLLSADLLQKLHSLTKVADIPSRMSQGAVIRCGQPVLSVRAKTHAQAMHPRGRLLRMLKQKHGQIRCLLDQEPG